MKKKIQFSLMLLGLTIAFVACQKDPKADIQTKALSNNSLSGSWQVIGTSGGFAGSGYNVEFDVLTVKDDGQFVLLSNNQVIASGELTIEIETTDTLLVNFKSQDSQNINLLTDAEKYVEIHDDTLLLNAPCCDRYNTALRRIK
jgi:hypothetical protein